MFIDEAHIKVFSGKGGTGCMSFRREKYVPRGGPDGGDGGDGGGIVFEVKQGMNTLHHLRFKKEYRAKNGLPGLGSNQHGKNGKDLVIQVPEGTVIRDEANDELIVDFDGGIEEWRVLDGGKGGRGNARFKSSINQSPRKFEYGGEGNSLSLKLTLKVIADVGLIGFPNAGKSSLLSRLSDARPKVADYPFTTLQPHLGVHVFGDYFQIVFADIPGIIEGASDGKGLGHQFLRHIERTKVLLHLVEPFGDNDPVERVKVIRDELKSYSEELSDRKEFVALSKSDLNPSGEDVERWEKSLGHKLYQISSATGEGLDELLKDVQAALAELS